MKETIHYYSQFYLPMKVIRMQVHLNFGIFEENIIIFSFEIF